MNKKILHEVIDQICLEYPDNIAIQTTDDQLSYGQLKALSDQISNGLESVISQQQDCITAVFMPSGIEYIISIIGINKAGAVFMPLETGFPRERIKTLIDRVKPEVIFTTDDYLEELKTIVADADYPVKMLQIGISENRLQQGLHIDGQVNPINTDDVKSTPQKVLSGDEGNYLIYTSGSTGVPKIILGKHKSLSHFIHWEQSELNADSTTKTVQLAPISFDVSFRDIFLPLISGGTVVIPDQQIKKDPMALWQFMIAHSITVAHMVPSVLKSIIDIAKNSDVELRNTGSLKTILLAGEALYNTVVKDWQNTFGNTVQLYNLYGPSETTLAKVFNKISEKDLQYPIVPLGQAISRSVVLIVRGKRLCAPGEIGEIYIKTPFLTHGYYGNNKLTDSVFIQNPLHSDFEDLVYKTGDLGNYADDGTVIFKGRMDSQVKIRGNRVELGEIESALQKMPEIKESVVKAIESNGELVLCCYLVFAMENGNQEDVLIQLKNQLPSYMIPSYVVSLDKMPRNLNGKVDRKGLPKPTDLLYASKPYTAPSGEIELAIAEHFSSILNLEKVSATHSFFEMGGHSLSATILVSAIIDHFRVDISLKEFFENPSVRKAGQLIDRKTDNDQVDIFPKVEILKEADHYPVSHGQRRLWVLEEMAENSTPYNISAAFQIKGDLDAKKLKMALSDLIKAHESLRTTFIIREGAVHQRVHTFSESLVYLEEIDLLISGEITQQEHQLSDMLKENAEFKFDLTETPLFRTTLIKTGDNQYVVNFCMHHIISDGWSLQVLFRDLIAAYNSTQLSSSEIAYKEYAVWQKSMLENGELNSQRDYWQEKLRDSNPVVELPVEFERSGEATFAGENQWFDLSGRLSERLKQFAQKSDCSEFVVLATAVNALLARYSGQTDFNIGTPLAGRTKKQFQDTIGFFVNTIVLRTQISMNDSVADGIVKMKKVVEDALNNQMYPHDKLIEDLQMVSAPQQNPLFNVMVVHHNRILEALQTDGSSWEISQIDIPVTTSKLDLSFEFIETEDGLRFNIEYRTGLFRKGTIIKMGRHLEELIIQMLENPDRVFGRLNILTPDETTELLQLSNHHNKKYLPKYCMHQLFENFADSDPDKIALSNGEQTMTYREVNEVSNQMAAYFIDHQLDRQVIGICLDRSFEMIITVLATLKAGGSYLPIDPYNPNERILFILEDASPAFLISEKQLMNNISAKVAYKEIDELLGEMKGYSKRNPQLAVDPLTVSYIIYTSGSTGNPKGALLTHHNVIRLYQSSFTHMDFNSGDVWPLFHSFGFDLSVWEIFGALMYGGRLVIVPFEVTRNPTRFAQLLIEEQVTVLTQTPSAFYNIIPHFTVDGDKKGSLRYVIFAGEALSVKRLSTWMEVYGVDSPELINMYGITETTIHVTYHKVGWQDMKAGNSVIGKALDDLQCYVLDEHLNLTPQGMRGELYVGGDGVGKGYLNRDELTTQRFIANPFSEIPDDIIYKSGDVVKLLPDGTMDYLGRADDQVKIQGFRIELGEVQSAILSIESIEFGFVKAVDNQSGNKQLVGYYKTIESETLSEESVRKYLINRLPYYMVPQILIAIDEIPLTNNGKIDYRSLPEVHDNISTSKESALIRDEQMILLSIWKEQIGLGEYPNPKDNFFELGGHSIVALKIINEIALKLDKQIRLQDFYAAPTVSSLADFISTKEEKRFTEIKKVPKEDHYDLSPNQRRFWVLEQLSHDKANFNISGAYKLSKEANDDLILRSINLLIGRHEILRTVITSDEIGQPVQQVLPFDSKIDWVETTDEVISGNQSVEKLIEKVVNQPFDLETGPLFKIVFAKLPNDESLLIVSIHHIISDGWSLGVITDEICKHYLSLQDDEKPVLKESAIQYKDYSAWLNRQLADGHLEAGRQYWNGIVNQISNPVLFPFDNEADQKNEYTGQIHPFSFDKRLSSQISDLVTTKKVSVFAFMMTVLNLLIYKRLGRKDITLGYPASGRDHPQLKDQLGYYMNMLLLHNELKEDKPVKDLTDRINREILNALEHQFYPVYTLENESERSEGNLFEVGLSWQNFADSQKGIMNDLPFSIEEIGDGNLDAIHPLWFFGEHTNEKFNFQILYKSGLYEQSTIDEIAADFELIARKIVEDSSFKIGDIFLKTNESSSEYDEFLSMLTKNTEELY